MVVVDNIVVQHPTLTFQPTVNLPDGSYQWRVTSRDRALNATSSVTRTFTVDTNPPGTPSLDSPLDNAFLNDNTPFFEWGPSAGDVSDYLLQVTSGDINSSPFDIEVTVLHPGTRHQAVAPLSDASYHWQVIARDQALNTASSVTRTFTVDITAPGIPNLLSPPNNTIFNDSTPLFVWEAASGDVTTYELRITSADINNGPLDVQVFVLAPTTQFQTSGGDALTDGTYIWRVIARDSAGNPQQYGVFIFSVDTVAPDAPALLAPADNASLGTRTPFFDWEDAPFTGDMINYELQVTSGGSFTQPLDMDVLLSGDTNQFQVPPEDALADGVYRWRVISRDKAFNFGTSDNRTFTVDTVAPGTPTLVKPASGDVTTATTPFFEWTPSSGDVFDYLLQVTSADSFNPQIDIEVLIIHPGTGHQAVNLLADATYRWRVIARERALNTASSIIQTFTVGTALTVTGTVRLQGRSDNSGARVTFSGRDPVFTDATGDFQVQLPPGIYDVIAERNGFLAAARTGLVLDRDLSLPGVKLLGGDVNADGLVGADDLVGVVRSLGKTGSLLAGDVNGDGNVDVVDLVIPARNQGRTESLWP